MQTIREASPVLEPGQQSAHVRSDHAGADAWITDSVADLLVSVVVPVFNERATVAQVVDRIRAVPGFRKQIVLVDDGSTDGSTEVLAQLARDPDVDVIRHLENRGKGAALRSGFAFARGDVVLIQDADLEYEPADYPRLLRPFVERGADVVYGSRFLVSEDARVHRFWHYLGNRVLTFLSNVATGLELTDMETCYKAFRRDVLAQIEIRSEKFDVEPELTAKVAKLGARVIEVPIRYDGRNYSQGKKIGWRDGVAAIWAIARHRYR